MPTPVAAALDPIPVLVEQRFPLRLSETVPSLRRLYHESKRDRWDPVRGVAWATLDPSAFDPEVRRAAARTWRRRAWIEATSLTETPAMVVRFCMERGREPETHMFLTVRNTEEAWQVEACDRLARRLAPEGERPPFAPGTDAYAAVFNRNVHRTPFDARTVLDALVARQSLFEDILESRLAELHAGNARHPVIRAVLERFASTKDRHAEFGRRYLAHRAPMFGEREREAIVEEIFSFLRDVEGAGYHLPWLVANAAALEARSDLATAAAGLGAATPAEEAEVLAATVAEVRDTLAPLGVTLPVYDHPTMGRL